MDSSDAMQINSLSFFSYLHAISGCATIPLSHDIISTNMLQNLNVHVNIYLLHEFYSNKNVFFFSPL